MEATSLSSFVHLVESEDLRKMHISQLLAVNVLTRRLTFPTVGINELLVVSA